jgi:hypothetical protein
MIAASSRRLSLMETAAPIFECTSVTAAVFASEAEATRLIVLTEMINIAAMIGKVIS